MNSGVTFARRVFLFAGVIGLLTLVPQYLMEARVGRDFPPPITHPEYFYGFVGVGMVFLIAAGVNHFGNIGTPIALTSIILFAGLFLLPFTVETKGQPLPR